MTIALGVGCTEGNLSSEGIKITQQQTDNSSEITTESTTTVTQEKPQTTPKSNEISQAPTATKKPKPTTPKPSTTTEPSTTTAKAATTTKVTTTTKSSTPKSTTTSPPSSTESEFEDEVLRLVNIERTSRGLKPLSNNAKLEKAADIRAVEIVGKFDHERPNGQDPFTAIEGNGGGFMTVSENIAAGYFTPEEVVIGWMNSPGHKANILNASFTHMGVGYYYFDNPSLEKNYRHYWVQMFGG